MELLSTVTFYDRFCNNVIINLMLNNNDYNAEVYDYNVEVFFIHL